MGEKPVVVVVTNSGKGFDYPESLAVACDHIKCC